LKSFWHQHAAKPDQIERADCAQKYLDVAGVIFVVLDRKGIVTLVNRKGCEILGCDAEHIIGKSWFENFLPADIGPTVRVVFQRLITGELEPVEYFENLIVTATGE
jgi:PAS domain S-box-containing protein